MARAEKETVRKPKVVELDLKNGIWIDGLSGPKRYLIVATLKTEADGNKVVVHPYSGYGDGGLSYKIKFYPSAEYWMVDPASDEYEKFQLTMRLDGRSDSSRGYDRFYTTEEGLKALIEHFNSLESVDFLTLRKTTALVEAKKQQAQRFNKSEDSSSED